MDEEKKEEESGYATKEDLKNLANVLGGVVKTQDEMKGYMKALVQRKAEEEKKEDESETKGEGESEEEKKEAETKGEGNGNGNGEEEKKKEVAEMKALLKSHEKILNSPQFKARMSNMEQALDKDKLETKSLKGPLDVFRTKGGF